MKNMRLIRRIDWIAVLLLVCLSVFSIMAISSATHTRDPSFVGKQLMWLVAGFAGLIVAMAVDWRMWGQGRFPYLLYGIGLFLLLLVEVPGLGTEVNGARQWIRIGGLQFQPSELIKPVFILLMAKLITEHRETFGSLKGLSIPIAALFAIPFLIILAQPDLGTGLVLAGILVAMLFVGGADIRWFTGGLAVLAGGVAGLWWLYRQNHPFLHVLLKPHQIERIQVFLDPASDPTGAGYQATQAKIAIGSGMMLGKGFHNGTQSMGNWIPEPHNDFIFAVIAEEFGFVGGCLLILLYLALIYRLIRIGMRSGYTFSSLIAAGVVGMLLFQVYQNIGMTLGLMPITGLPLPLMSYGGTSLITQLVSVGMVLGLGMRPEPEKEWTVFED
ncbi:rod shape-determining protein RodA [Staphylospora marina]|uniref:rod shape-determining protein RodA n=1 Tax=Staphylospora marina TaxID=2490858 RepID=UPI000F5B918D|nr:rod shape-determining protein RodA [Staphylospora marina]